MVEQSGGHASFASPQERRLCSLRGPEKQTGSCPSQSIPHGTGSGGWIVLTFWSARPFNVKDGGARTGDRHKEDGKCRSTVNKSCCAFSRVEDVFGPRS